MKKEGERVLGSIFRSREGLEKEGKKNLLFYRDLNSIETILLVRIDLF
jgi:hypothetical protein